MLKFPSLPPLSVTTSRGPNCWRNKKYRFYGMDLQWHCTVNRHCISLFYGWKYALFLPEWIPWKLPISFRSRYGISLSILNHFFRNVLTVIRFGIIIEHTHCLWNPVLGISSLSTRSAVAFQLFFSRFLLHSFFECHFYHFYTPFFDRSFGLHLSYDLTMFFETGISIVDWLYPPPSGGDHC